MILRTVLLVIGLVPLTAAPLAADDDDGKRAPMVVTHAATLAECSACHIAYPAALLPQRSWTAIMATLGDHFGEDASLDAATRAEIEAYLVANAADTGGRSRALRGVDATATPLRITELPWFRREHDGEVSQALKDKAKSMANCAACHTGAEQGLFDDD